MAICIINRAGGAGGGGSITVDDSLSTTSINPVQNKVITSNINTINTSLTNKADISSLAAVATSGSYNDLSNKPTIPAAVAVKGNSESSYRTGNVNLTAANIGAAAASHAHGNIASGGTLGADVAKASGDKFVLVDASDSNKIVRSNIALGTSTTTFLRNDGTWGTPAGVDTKAINTKSILTTISASELADASKTWTATTDCWVIFSNHSYDGNMSHGFGYLYIDDVELCNQNCNRFAVIAKKNSVIKVRRYAKGVNNFDVKCYGVK